MTYTFSGSAATSITPSMPTQIALADQLGGDFPEGAEKQRVLVLEDAGNQLAYVIEGSREEILAMLDRARQAVHDAPEPCPYTFSHTRHWCGNPDCRES